MLRALFGPETSWPLLRRLFAENAREHVRGYAFALVLMAIIAATTAALAWTMESVVDEVLVEGDRATVNAIALTIAAIFILRGAATFGQQVTLARIGNAIVAKLQRRLYERTLTQDLAFHRSIGQGELITHMSRNAESARAAIQLVVTSLGRDLLTLIALVAVMIAKDPLMSLLALVTAPVAIGGIAYLARRIRRAARAQFAHVSRVVATMQETAAGIRVVKAFGLEGRMRARADEAIAQVEERTNRIASLNARTSPLTETFAGLAVAAVILYAGWQARETGRPAGEVVAFLTALLLAYDPAKRLAKLAVNLRKHLVGVELLYGVFDAEPGLTDAPDAEALRVEGGAVRLDGVTYAYEGEGRAALRDVTLEAHAGEVTALVGPSGAGKTTVMHLLERFDDPQAGRVTIDGQDLRGVTLASLRRAIAFVSQDTFLFEGTVRENVAMGTRDADEAAIRAALEDANATGFVDAMPGGLDARIGTGGEGLSGGQRQRLAIARAMVRDAPILLLDEATSALDARAEAAVTEALDRLMRGRTTIVIAHRLSTVRGADVIHVMDEGRVVQSGSHEQLIAKGGLYASLHALQFRDEAAA